MKTSEKLFWVTYFVILAMVAFSFIAVHADTIEDEGKQVKIYGSISDDEVARQIREYHRRGEEYQRQVEAEIQRHQELEIEKAKIEVLARLNREAASQVNVSASARVDNRINQRQEVQS